jgi:S-adenosylmethionine synthetase
LQPLSVYLDTYGTGTKSDSEILSIVNANFDLRPGVIRRELNLTRPIYEKTAYHGHFGESLLWFALLC